MSKENGNAADKKSEPSAPTHFRSTMDYEDEYSLRAALKEPPYRETFSNGAGSQINCDSCPIQEATSCSPLCDWQTNNLDLLTSTPQSFEEEVKRLTVLREYAILDSDHEEQFERITALSSRIFDVPICLVSLVDIGRQWFMSNRGLGDVRETSRHLSFCAHAILSQEDVFIVPETKDDHRFCDSDLVKGFPYIRFYAGAPLLAPEGYKLGSFCIIDTKPHPEGLSLNEKQNLRELAAMVMDIMVKRKQDLERVRNEKTRVIACAAHDLLSPLTGVQLNLGLLMDDETLNEQQKEWVNTSVKCSEMIERICVQAIESFRGELGKRSQLLDESDRSQPEEGIINLAHFVKHIDKVIGTFPKTVPLSIEVDENVPPAIISDDLKIFRSAMNYLTNACKHTKNGFIRLHIYVRKSGVPISDIELDLLPGSLAAPKRDLLVVEVIDTGPGVELERYPTLFTPFDQNTNTDEVNQSKVGNFGIGLYSVATEISSLGGEYGVFPREDLEISNLDTGMDPNDPSMCGSVFWFSVPLVLPKSQSEPNDMKEMLLTLNKRNGKEQAHAATNSFRIDTAGTTTIEDDSKLMPAPKHPSVKRKSLTQSDMDVDSTFFTKKKPTPSSSQLCSEEAPLDTSKAVSKLLSGVSFSSKQPERQKRALIIDDSVTIRKALAKGFSRIGFEVDDAENGLQGLKKLKATPYEIVLLDFLMPVMDGLDVVKKYRTWEGKHRSWFHQFIVGISAHANGKDAELGLKSGMDRFMQKPVPLKSLKDLASSKPVIDASLLLDMKHKETSDAFAKLSDGKHHLDDEKSLGSSTSCGSSVSLSESFLKNSCLIAVNNETASHGLQRIAEINGWRAVVVSSGDDAIRLLKMHNWGTVFIDTDLSQFSGVTCVARFRDWEKRSRVVRQRNIFLMSSTYNAYSSAPPGFDGVVCSPLVPAQIASILDNASKETFKLHREILSR